MQSSYKTSHDVVSPSLIPQACVSLKDITAISKQKTALVFPNAILVEVGDKKVSGSQRCDISSVVK